MPVDTMPDIAAIIEPHLGLAYEQFNCWNLVRFLFKQGWDIDFDQDPAFAMAQLEEIWFIGQDTDPRTILQPWDGLVFRNRGLASQHVGVVVDARKMAHADRNLGLCLVELTDWLPPRSSRLLQIARLKRLRTSLAQ